MIGNASNPANRQESSTNICKSTAEVSPPKPSQKRLMIKFPDGTIISNDDIEETYIDALWELDPDSIMLNNISFNGISIITSKNTRGGRVQVGINQWAYVPSLTMDIIKVLETISKALNIDIEIHEIN